MTGTLSYNIDDSGSLALEQEKSTIEKSTIQAINMDEYQPKTFCPHKKLLLLFKPALNAGEQIKLKKRMRKIHFGDPNIIILKDVKDLVLYHLLLSPVSNEFIQFFHLPLVDRILRALIFYFQYFLKTWNELEEKRLACKKKIQNPLAGGARLNRSLEMKAIRCLLAREYIDLVMGCQKANWSFHHSFAGTRAINQSNGEKELRIFEPFLRVAHHVVWITLNRQQSGLIETEINRLFRSEAFNSLKNSRFSDLPINEHWILYGPKLPKQQKCLQISALPYEILNTTCNYRLLSLAFCEKKSKCPQINYLEEVLTANESDLSNLGIKLGILGHQRDDFDIILRSLTNENISNKGASENDNTVSIHQLALNSHLSNDQFPITCALRSINKKTTMDF